MTQAIQAAVSASACTREVVIIKTLYKVFAESGYIGTFTVLFVYDIFPVQME